MILTPHQHISQVDNTKENQDDAGDDHGNAAETWQHQFVLDKDMQEAGREDGDEEPDREQGHVEKEFIGAADDEDRLVDEHQQEGIDRYIFFVAMAQKRRQHFLCGCAGHQA